MMANFVINLTYNGPNTDYKGRNMIYYTHILKKYKYLSKCISNLLIITVIYIHSRYTSKGQLNCELLEKYE